MLFFSHILTLSFLYYRVSKNQNYSLNYLINKYKHIKQNGRVTSLDRWFICVI